MSEHVGFSKSELLREEIAKIEVGQTTITPATVRGLLGVFLAFIAAVPLFEFVATVRAQAEGDTAPAWTHLTGLPGAISLELAKPDHVSPWGRTVAANRVVLAGLESFESALEDESRLGRLLRPPTQIVLSGWLGVGNEQVYTGRDGWLFYRPDVEYVTGRGFLTPAQLERRIAAASEWTDPPQPDPRRAIVQFKRDLEARGITLIVMPTPVKPTIHPEGLVGAYGRWPRAVQNPSYDRFLEDLRRAGVLVFDPAQAFVDARGSSRQAYLSTDTHWRPETMQLAADRLAELVSAHVSLPAVAEPGYKTERRMMQNVGDSTRMLDLPRTQRQYPAETVTLRRVVAPDGSSWQPSRSADILVLGDSFSNIYTLASMGWGESAGFVEQLSYALQRPIDRIVQNDDGAFATRALLRRGRAERLKGKRVVIYQFATRELAIGDWKLIRLNGSP